MLLCEAEIKPFCRFRNIALGGACRVRKGGAARTKGPDAPTGGMTLTDKLPPEVAAAHWGKTRSLMLTTLAIWAVFSFFIHMFVTSLNGVVILGFPLGYYMAAQGSLIVFVVLIFWFASRQNSIDEEFGVAED